MQEPSNATNQGKPQIRTSQKNFISDVVKYTHEERSRWKRTILNLIYVGVVVSILIHLIMGFLLQISSETNGDGPSPVVSTKIDFAIPYDSDVLIQIYDIQGREVVSLLDDNIDAGYHSIVWNASSYSSGMYFVKMLALSEADGGPSKYLKTQKLMLVK